MQVCLVAGGLLSGRFDAGAGVRQEYVCARVLLFNVSRGRELPLSQCSLQNNTLYYCLESSLHP